MKKHILKASLVIILLTIFASSCDKTGSSSSSGGGGNATNLALTNANITGTWLGTNGTDTIISKINFSNNVDYVFTMSDGYEIEGTYTILDSNSIKLANGIEDTLVVSLLSSTNFNFNFGDGNVFYTIREVNPNAPTCSITSPSDGADLPKGNAVAISVDANSASGTIADVKIYVNNVLKNTLTESPYTYTWETSAEALGNKTIKATATDDSGNEKTSEITIILSEGGSSDNPPVAAFVASSTSVNVGEAVQFTSQSTNNPTSYSWTFGDGGTSTAQNPSHTYTSEGNYDVSLTVANGAGTDTVSKYGYISCMSNIAYTHWAGVVESVDIIDFNNDSIGDLHLSITLPQPGCTDCYTYLNFGDDTDQIAGVLLEGLDLIGDGNPDGWSFQRLPLGKVINENDIFDTSVGIFMVFESGWNNNFYGCKLLINGSLHYAWIRIDIGYDSDKVMVIDYAYNRIPNTAITVGEGIPE